MIALIIIALCLLPALAPVVAMAIFYKRGWLSRAELDEALKSIQRRSICQTTF